MILRSSLRSKLQCVNECVLVNSSNFVKSLLKCRKD